MGRFQISRIIRICRTLAMGLWALSGLAFMGCFFLYYMYGGIFAFLLLVTVILGILYQSEDHLLYHPELPTHARVFVPIPTMFGLPYENLYIRSADGTLLHMFFIKQPLTERSTKCPTIVFFHGNAGNIGHRLSNASGLFHTLKCNLLLLEYRGYGLSEGVPSEEGLYMDARSAVDYITTRSDINKSEIVIFGRSLGGAVAIDLACRPEYADKIWCVIVENTFTSIPEMAKVFVHWKCVHYIPLCFYKNKFLSSYKITMLRVPILFVSGLGDNLVPPRMMNELHSRCGSEIKQIIQIPNGTHNETWTMSGYYRNIGLFLKLNADRKKVSNPSNHAVDNLTSATSNNDTIVEVMSSRTWQNIQNI